MGKGQAQRRLGSPPKPESIAITAKVRKGKRRQQTIRIENPLIEGKGNSTTLKAAQNMVRRGIAEWVSHCVIRRVLSRKSLDRGGTAWIDRQIDTAINRNHPAGIVFWNGCDHRRMAMHKPGEMPAFPDPDAGLR